MADIQGPTVDLYNGGLVLRAIISDVDGRLVRMETHNVTNKTVRYRLITGGGSTLTNPIVQGDRTFNVPTNIGTQVDMRDPDEYTVDPTKSGWTFQIES